MGFFNTLTTEMICPNCGVKSLVRLQFKYGNTRQLEYNMGDTLTWGGNDVGNADLTNVKAYGIVESMTCPACNEDKIPEEYDIFIKDNVLTGVAPIENMEEYLAGDGDYVVLE